MCTADPVFNKLELSSQLYCIVYIFSWRGNSSFRSIPWVHFASGNVFKMQSYCFHLDLPILSVNIGHIWFPQATFKQLKISRESSPLTSSVCDMIFVSNVYSDTFRWCLVEAFIVTYFEATSLDLCAARKLGPILFQSRPLLINRLLIQLGAGCDVLIYGIKFLSGKQWFLQVQNATIFNIKLI